MAAIGGPGRGGRAQRGTTGNTRSPARRRVRRAGRKTGRRLGLLLLVVLVVGGVWLYRSGVVDRRSLGRIPVPGLEPPETREVTLYFADPRWSRLVPEPRSISADTRGTVATATLLVEELAEGSRAGHSPTLPADARLRGAYVGRAGLLVLDFEADLLGFDPGGAAGEALTVFGLVHTVAENLPEVHRMQLLIGGEERETFAGHVKISEPLQPDPQWIERTDE